MDQIHEILLQYILYNFQDIRDLWEPLSFVLPENICLVKYFLIAGEPSGDQHAGRPIKALREKDQEAEFLFLGGDRMSDSGQKPVVHIREMAFMGFTQVLSHLGKIRINFKKAKEAICSSQEIAGLLTIKTFWSS